MTTREQISKRPIGRFVAARNILSASLAFHAGHQTLLLPATKRFTFFQMRSAGPPPRRSNNPMKNRPGGKKGNGGRRAISCPSIHRRKFRYRPRYAIYFSGHLPKEPSPFFLLSYLFDCSLAAAFAIDATASIPRTDAILRTIRRTGAGLKL